MTPISAIIITRNEERHIAEAISSLSCCEEVLVIDAESTDRTREIAERCGARVIVRSWDGFASQKNFGAIQARYDWIFSLDVDEWVSIELVNEIQQWKRKSEETAARSMPRIAFYLGSWIRHSGWYPDRKVRLFSRSTARWTGDSIHEKLESDGPVERFKGDILHFPFRDWIDHLQRIDRYTVMSSEAAHRNGKRANLLMLVAGPPITFLRTFFLRLGFLDGWRGVMIAYAAARYIYLRELRILR